MKTIYISDDEDSPGDYSDGYEIEFNRKYFEDVQKPTVNNAAAFDTAKEFLHQNSGITETVTKAKAYVVFNGRNLGIFTDWFVFAT